MLLPLFKLVFVQRLKAHLIASRSTNQFQPQPPTTLNKWKNNKLSAKWVPKAKEEKLYFIYTKSLLEEDSCQTTVHQWDFTNTMSKNSQEVKKELLHRIRIHKQLSKIKTKQFAHVIIYKRG